MASVNPTHIVRARTTKEERGKGRAGEWKDRVGREQMFKKVCERSIKNLHFEIDHQIPLQREEEGVGQQEVESFRVCVRTHTHARAHHYLGRDDGTNTLERKSGGEKDPYTPNFHGEHQHVTHEARTTVSRE